MYVQLHVHVYMYMAVSNNSFFVLRVPVLYLCHNYILKNVIIYDWPAEIYSPICGQSNVTTCNM